MIGPFRGGRVNAVSGVPGQPNTFYFGSVGGGVWKTTNAGRTWTADLRLAAGRLDRRDRRRAVQLRTSSTSAPARPTCAIADLVRQRHVQVDRRRQDLDAHRPRRHAADRPRDRRSEESRTSCSSRRSAMPTAPNPDRGVYRSRDGGATWQKVLFKDNDIGAIDLAFDPTNSQTVYATLWNMRRPPWFIYPPSYGPGGGIFKSTDGGTNWTAADARPAGRRRRPHRHRRRAASNPRRASTRSSTRRRAACSDRTMPARLGPRRPATRASGDAAGTSARSSSIRRTRTSSTSRTPASIDRRDGGQDLRRAVQGIAGRRRLSQLWISPDDPNRMILGSDQGAVVSVDGLNEHPTWSSWYNQPTAQIYHVAADYSFPLLGDRRAAGQRRGARPFARPHSPKSRCATGSRCAPAARAATPRPIRCIRRSVRRHGRRAATSRPARRRTCRRKCDLPTPARHTLDAAAGVLAGRSARALFRNQFLYKTTNGGESWTQISEDLTREDPGVPPNLDAAAAADAPTQANVAASSTRSRRRRCARRCSGSAPTMATST